MSQQSTALLERAITLSHEASTDPARWTEFVGVFERSCKAAGGALFTPGLDPELRRFHVNTGSMSTPTGIAGYFEHWFTEDPWNNAVAGTGFFEVAGELHVGCEFLPDAALRHTAYYNDYGRELESGHKLSLKVCDADDAHAPVTHLVLNRPLSQDGFDDEDKQRARILWPHVRRAVHTHWMLQRARELSRAGAAALDVLPLPAWVVRADATIEFANVAARALEPSAAWQCDRSSRLHKLGDLDAAALREVVRLAPSGPTQAVALADRGRPVRGTLRVAPVAEVALYVTAWPRAYALLMLEMPSESADRQWLQRTGAQYGLTSAERRVLEQLGAGRTVEQIAAEQRVNASTVRTHLRALFAKTGRGRQSDLVRLALGR